MRTFPKRHDTGARSVRPILEALEGRMLLSVGLVPVAQFPGHLPITGTGGAKSTTVVSSAHRAANVRPAITQPITLTNALLVDSSDKPVTTPDKGEEVFVEADWNTQNLPSGASYKISYSIDGVTLETGPLTFGAGSGTLQSWYWYLGGWFASPGTHSVAVSIDPTTYSSSSKMFTFTPISAPDLPEKFITPLGGIPQQTWGIVNYVDVNPTSPAFADFNGGDYTYDGHTGHDMTLADFALMDAGVPDYAAADGTVVAVQDGNFDRNTSFNSSAGANYVEIDHGNGWHTLYYHFRKDTILVHVGDHVKAGQILGLAGSSGYSTGAHLHFEVQHNGDVVEEEYDPTTFWLNPLPYQGTLSSVLESGVTTNHDAALNDLNAEERPVSANTFTQAAGQQLTVWMESFTRNNDAVSFQFFMPDGAHDAALDYSFTATESRGGYWYAYETLPAGLALGQWHVDVLLNGAVKAIDPFQVTTGGAGAAHVTLGSGLEVPNGRTTPLLLGPVNVGAAAPQQTYFISNIGSAGLSLGNLSLPAGYSVVGTMPTYIPVGGSAALTIRLSTAAAGTFAGLVSFNTSDPNAPLYRFSVRGTVNGGDTGQVHGQVFFDYNKDAIENSPDVGLSGWTVSLLDPATSAVIATTTTSFNGYYRFYNVAPGTYAVRQTPQFGATQTTADPANVTVASNDVLASPFGVNFSAAVASVTPADELSNGKTVGDAAPHQRSRISRLLVTFNQPVTLKANPFTLQLLNVGGSGSNDGSPPTDASAALDDPVQVGTDATQWYIPITPGTAFSDSSGSLMDGLYILKAHGAAILANGSPLGSDSVFAFHRLFGDIDGNAIVNNADYLRFKSDYLQNIGSPAYNLDLDYDQNGTISNSDYLQFRKRYLKSFSY